ncbi:MAG: PilZ domain-containing protein [Deltaproteobacteria bacterium]|nr:PilZ domain-containing protein [Deltaproteobacteria bacterium]
MRQKRAVERRARARKNLPHQRLQRTSAQIQIRETGDVIAGRVFLSDITPDGVGVFLAAPLQKGEEVFLVLEHPKHLFLRAEVVWCNLYRRDTRIISAENFQYRAGIKFQFDTESDQLLVNRYFEEIILTTK